MPDEAKAPRGADEVLAALLALTTPNAKTFLAQLGEEPTLLADCVRIAAEAPLWLDATVTRLRDAGVTAGDARRLGVIVREQLREHKRARRGGFRVVDEEVGPPLVRDALPSAPVSLEAVIPAGYRLSRFGITEERTGEHGAPNLVEIAPAPIVITGRLLNADGGEEFNRLAWIRDQAWKTATVARTELMDRSRLINLAGQGLPVYSGSAGDLAKYLAAYEATNQGVIPRGTISQHMGWQGRAGERGFLVGRRLITADGEDAGELDPAELTETGWAEDHLAFHGADEGDNQLADGFGAAGELAAWAEALAPLTAYPKAMIALYLSLTAPLQLILGAGSFVVDWAGVTSQGKTTVLKVAASCWGNPDPTVEGSVLGAWNSSRVYRERRAALYHGLPVILDDTKQAKSAAEIGQAIYDLTAGQGRGRGSPHGMRRSGTWRTVILSTGESPLVEATQDGGTRARVITLWGSPFGGISAETGLAVNRLNLQLAAHHGHAGPAFVQYLLANRDRWEHWRALWREVTMEYHELAPDNAIAGRIGQYLAAVQLAAVIAHECLPLPWEYADPVEPIWDVITQQTSEADRAQAALEHVMSWAAANQHTFEDRLDHDKDWNERTPAQGLSGKWDRATSWKSIAFVPHRLKDVLEDAGFEAEAVLRTWRDREWIETASDRKRYQKLVRIQGEPTWAIVVKRPDWLLEEPEMTSRAA